MRKLNFTVAVWLPAVFLSSIVVGCDDRCGKTNGVDTCTDGNRLLSRTRSSMALVPYSPPVVFSEFRQSTKTFTFCGRDVIIRQRWDELGVAAVVWDAAVVLAEYLEKSANEQKLTIRRKLIIEIGAGTGLVGIVAALLGGNVVLTDRRVALDQLKANVESNLLDKSLRPNGGRSGISSSIDGVDQTVQFNTGQDDIKTRIAVKELSWGDNLRDFPNTFDIIIGADIVYLEDTFEKLLETMVHLSSRDSVVLLSCRIRYDRDERFLDMMRVKFLVKEIFHEMTRNIHVYEGKLK